MAITLNKQAVRCEDIAKACGKITPTSPVKILSCDISRAWRNLDSIGSNYKSQLLQEWSEKEVAAAEVMITTLTYLQRIGCRNIESLLLDCISLQEKGNK